MSRPLVALGGLSLILLGTGCVPGSVIIQDGPRPYRSQPVYTPPPPPAPAVEVVSVYIEPPIGQPEPVACPWAPPAMLVEQPPPAPFEGAIWTGGYWVWHGTWVWAHGRWAAPPRPRYRWHHPYYENRDGVVVFVTGHWGPPGVEFVPPPPHGHFVMEEGAPGVVRGPRPIGPQGCFVPPPPGSRAGIIVPAPMGTSPAVVTGAPPVVNVGMHITNNDNHAHYSNTTVNNVTNVTNITNLTIAAPPSATASGRAVNNQVSGQAYLAAAQTPVVRAPAPAPVSTRPIAPFQPGQRPALPPGQPIPLGNRDRPVETPRPRAVTPPPSAQDRPRVEPAPASPRAQPTPAPRSESTPAPRVPPAPTPRPESTPAPRVPPAPTPRPESTPAPRVQPAPTPRPEPTPAPRVQPAPAPRAQPAPAPAKPGRAEADPKKRGNDKDKAKKGKDLKRPPEKEPEAK